MADTADSRKRWDTDDRFTGVADASDFAPAIADLAALARRPGWVAEDPEIHLVPHLQNADVPGCGCSAASHPAMGCCTSRPNTARARAVARSGGTPGR